MKVYKSRTWEWFEREGRQRGDITGKFLIFSPERSVLRAIAEDEVSDGEFDLAKISLDEERVGAEYVLCLYAHDNNRLVDMQTKYGNRRDIYFRGWKSNEDTRAGKYSSKYLEARDRKSGTGSKIGRD